MTAQDKKELSKLRDGLEAAEKLINEAVVYFDARASHEKGHDSARFKDLTAGLRPLNINATAVKRHVQELTA